MGWVVAAAVIAVFVVWAIRSSNRALSKVDIEPRLRRARILLWLRQLEKADAEFAGLSVYSAHPRAAVVMAYHSLFKRLQGDAGGALQVADRAVRKQPDCFEAHAARSLALLTKQQLVPAFEAYTQTTRLTPSDVEGHILRLQLFMLYIEMVQRGKEDAQGVTLQHLMTPLVTGTACLLDGYPERGFAHFRKDGGWLAQIGEAMCEYRYGSNDAAIEQWKALLLRAPSIGGTVLPSLRYMVAHAERDGQGEGADPD